MTYKLFSNTTLVFETTDYDIIKNLFFAMGGNDNQLTVTSVDTINYVDAFEKKVF